MNLVECTKCKEKINDTLKKCPNCGLIRLSWARKHPFKFTFLLLISGFFLIIIIGMIIAVNTPASVSNVIKPTSGSTATMVPTLSAEQIRDNKIKFQFSAWDGSNRALEKYIKSSMNDPKSYEHVETRYSDEGDYLFVSTTFRGKNAFGGVVTNNISAKISLDGDIIEILSQ
jgi:hypothetical protein